MSTQQKRLDVICIGRIAVDLYGQQIGARLEDETTFAKYLGAHPATWLTAPRFRV